MTTAPKTYFYDSDVTIETYKPKLTRDICSVFEFVRIVTDLANHLYTLPSIEKYIDGIEVKNIIENQYKLGEKLLTENLQILCSCKTGILTSKWKIPDFIRTIRQSGKCIRKNF